MRYRDTIINNIDVLESHLKTLRRMVQRGEEVSSFLSMLDLTEDRVAKVREYVDLEPRVAEEVGGR